MKSCAHAACGCLVAKEEQYCSERCRERWEARHDPNERCRCGHIDCLAERGVREPDGELTTPPEDSPRRTL